MYSCLFKREYIYVKYFSAGEIKRLRKDGYYVTRHIKKGLAVAERDFFKSDSQIPRQGVVVVKT
jgi:hypothetical protein